MQYLPRPINPEPRGFRIALISLSTILGVALVWAVFHMLLTGDLTTLARAAHR